MTTLNFAKVFKTFRANYQLVPLELFGKHPYKTLVSTLMSSRTNDNTTLAAAKRLFVKASTFRRLAMLSPTQIEKLIYPVGFYKIKARNLQCLATKILADFNGKVPRSIEELTSLPGVGRKTANLVLNRAFGIPAIAVDTHVHRIANLLGWVKTTTPELTEQALTKVLPKKYWSQTNRLFVSIGRQYPRGKAKKFLEENKLI